MTGRNFLIGSDLVLESIGLRGKPVLENVATLWDPHRFFLPDRRDRQYHRIDSSALAQGTVGRFRQAHEGIAPYGARLDIRKDGGLVVATVTAQSILLPGLTIRAETVSAVEPTEL